MDNTLKRVPKNPITFKLPLTAEQKEAKRVVLDNKITVLTGIAGTSKTFLSVQIALDQLFKREVNRITIMRPTVASEDIGALPGTVDEKMAMWMIPIVENMYIMYDKVKIDKMLKEGEIRMLPLQFTQGITFSNEFVILDEAQNATPSQMKMIMTRIGVNSKIVITGDIEQADRKSADNGLLDLQNRLGKGVIPGLQLCHFDIKDVQRHRIIEHVLNLYGR